MNHVEIKNIYKRFGDQTVLDDISFTIQAGERFGLIGPNGAGKSTLIDIICGLKLMDSGEILINQQSTQQDIVSIRKDVGLVPQELALMEDLNAQTNLEYFGTLYGLSGKILKERIGEILDVVGLTEQGKKKVKEYSGGMKRRLNIAAAVLHRPKFLILDEPTVGVDPQSRNAIFEFIANLNETNKTTVLYTSHYMEEVEALCERLIIIDKGKQIAYGTKAQIKELVSHNNKWVVTGEGMDAEILTEIQRQLPGIESLYLEGMQAHLITNPQEFESGKLLHFLQNHQFEISSIYKEDVSLEETFLQLTGKSLRD